MARLFLVFFPFWVFTPAESFAAAPGEFSKKLTTIKLLTKNELIN